MKTRDTDAIADELESGALPAIERPRRRHRVWRRFLRDPAAIAGALILLIMFFTAYAAPMIAPRHYDDQLLTRRLRPAFSSYQGQLFILGDRSARA